MSGGQSDVMVVLTNAPDPDVARRIAEALIERRLAACVNILAPCISVYRWKGVVEQSAEIPLLIKTTASCYAALEAALRSLHPYELPEIVAVGAASGLAEYLAWVNAECS